MHLYQAQIFLGAKCSRASAVKAGAAMASKNCLGLAISAAASPSQFVDTDDPPYAETGSQASAFERLPESLRQWPRRRVGVFDDDHDAGSESPDGNLCQLPAGVEIDDVVEAESLPWSWRAPATPKPEPSHRARRAGADSRRSAAAGPGQIEAQSGGHNGSIRRGGAAGAGASAIRSSVLAIAVSYAAVVAKAWRASRQRVSRLSAPWALFNSSIRAE